jgi:alpha-tubulin suppressor-like RCC1 family protein
MTRRAALIALLGVPSHLSASALDTVRVQPALSDSGAVAVAAAVAQSQFACVLRPSGRVQCWGGNESGQLGIGRRGSRTESVGASAVAPSDAGSRVVALSLGDEFACALTARGRILCWGANQYGQLGDGTTQRRTRPVAVNSDETFASVSAGDGYACALNREGRAFCWGKNDDPPTLGTGDSTERHRPTPVSTSLRFSRLSVGRVTGSACGIARDSLAYCWGAGIQRGALDAAFVRPTVASARVRFRDIAVGNRYACGISVDADLYCWGQFGYADVALPSAPTNPWPGRRKFATISTSSVSLCGITTAQQLLCWGNNSFGLAGIGPVDTVRVGAPTPVSSSVRFKSVSVGGTTACAISVDDQLYCWGVGIKRPGGSGPAGPLRSVPERF